jgi:hypothetical protein
MKITTTLYSGITAMGLMLCLSTQPALGNVTVTVLPGNQVALVGSNVVFNAQVSATAGETNLRYTWLTSPNGLNPFTTISGATTATCTLTGVQTNNTGFYFCRVTFDSGSNLGLTSVSAAVTLTVFDQARIITQPVGGLIRVAGSNASFSVTAAGSLPLGYQWRLNRTNLTTGGRITGATSADLTIAALVAADTGNYDVVVTNAYTAATSQVATLIVYVPPGISVPPQNTAVILGSNATFRVTATGSVPIGFRWQKDGTNLTNGGRISGATSNVLTIATTVTNDEGGYSVSLSNIVGSLTSSAATLTILVPATITSATDATGRQGAFFSFTNTATGTTPITFGADGLPDGLSIESVSGVISGIPAVMGVFNVAVYATNAAMTTTGHLVLSLTTGVPGITSKLSANGKQGQPFNYTITASNDPVSFSASVLPTGMSLDPATGVISGSPMVNGTYPITIGASNQYGSDSQVLTLSLTSSVPVITSKLVATGKQGQNFSYTLTTTDPATLSAGNLPPGLHFDSATGIISGPPILSGIFQIALGATNQFGSDSRVLTLTVASSVPVITSALTATGTENDTNFSYTIQASNGPTTYGASGLPLGLTVNTNTGAITGTPMYGGTFTVPIWAMNAWGTGSTNLVLTISYATVGGLAITDVGNIWSKPYLLDFSFSLRDGSDPASNGPVVVSPSLLQVVCMEGGVPIPAETGFVLESGDKKQLKSFLVLDYTYSMFAVPGAIDAMQEAAKLLINDEPAHALFGIYEFHADYVAPQMVTTNPATTNGFIADKAALSTIIDGIQTNYVKGNYAGTRCWDAMYAALSKYGPTNRDERRCLIVMSDGNDDSSLLNASDDPVGDIVTLAQANQVRIFCVAFGNDVNTNALEQLTAQTGGHYYLATTPDELNTQFQKIVKDIDGQYLLRWATLQRAAKPFQPSFQVTYGGFTVSFNTELLYQTNTDYTTNITVDTGQTPPVTNIDIITNITVTNILVLPFNPPDWTNDVRIGSLRLVPDSDVGPQTIRLRATYVPRYVRQVRLNYRPNYPCTASLDSTGTNELLDGWSMVETADTNGLRTLTMSSPDPTNQLTSMEYAAFGDLVSFNFAYPESLTATQAFSEFSVDNSLYTNVTPAGIRFTNENFTSFVKLYPPAPPHGTPIPWLISYGFTTNFAAAELIATNGLPVWQAYLAGLNPTNANSRFDVSTAFEPGQTPQVLFSTVVTRKYRVETTTSLGSSWAVLRDNIPGTGGYILFIDNRVLSGANAIFYRVAVH